MHQIQFTDEEQAAARRFLSSSGIAEPGSPIDVMILLGYLASVIRFAMLDFPMYGPLRLAAARYAEFEHMAVKAAFASSGLYFSRTDEPTPTPVDPPPGVDGASLGTRALPSRPAFLDGPPLPVCLVDPMTLFCQTHQGMHVAEDATIFDVLIGGQ